MMFPTLHVTNSTDYGLIVLMGMMTNINNEIYNSVCVQMSGLEYLLLITTTLYLSDFQDYSSMQYCHAYL
jgi:hypothetical protein